MKTYTIQRNSEGRVGCYVSRPRQGTEEHDCRYSLFHLEFHSPDGFETGNGGSGPADLALSILADHFKERAAQRPAEGRLQCWAVHQLFKDTLIAPNKLEPGEQYTITEDEIVQWLASLEKGADSKQA